MVERAERRLLLDIEAEAVSALKAHIGADFARAVDIVFKCRGRIVVSGVGNTTGTALVEIYGDVPAYPAVALNYIPTSISHQRSSIDYAQVASTSRFFNDRLAVMLGARRDAVTNLQQTTTGIPVDPLTVLPAAP